MGSPCCALAARWRRGTVRLGHRPARGPLRIEGGGCLSLADAAFPGVERCRADPRSPAELGDRETGLLLAFDLPAPPLAPRFPIGWRSESDHGGSPGAEYVDYGSR